MNFVDNIKKNKSLNKIITETKIFNKKRELKFFFLNASSNNHNYGIPRTKPEPIMIFAILKRQRSLYIS